jgi:hypothetical protein
MGLKPRFGWMSKIDQRLQVTHGDHFIFGTSGLAAGPGYPIVQVPAGQVVGVPLGISFFGTAFSVPKLIKLASGYEAFTQAGAKNLPTFAATIPTDNIAGTTLTKVKSKSESRVDVDRHREEDVAPLIGAGQSAQNELSGEPSFLFSSVRARETR